MSLPPTDDERRQTQQSGRATRRSFLRAAGAGLGATAVGGVGGVGGFAGSAGAAVESGVPTPRLHTDGKWIRDPDGNPV